jgi:hypothetical protein
LQIENPRTGNDLRYVDDPQYGYLASVFTDESYLEESAVLFWQDALPPLPGLSGLIYMTLTGQDVLNETALPTEHLLDDWPFAAIFLGADSPLNGVTAAIFSIAPVSAGDFNQDGIVNAADRTQWEFDYGDTSGSDADRDGDSDGADFLVWQRQLGTSMEAFIVGQTSAVPEASTIVLAMLSAMPRLAIRRTS